MMLWFQRILDEPNGPVILAAWVIWVVVSITLHELAHGWMAVRLGDSTPIDSGHMTFNPIVHMGIPSLVVFALAGIAWGAMPIDPSRLRGRYAYSLVALAGPAMNFILAAVCIVCGGLWVGLAAPTPSGTGPVSVAIYEQLRIFFLFGGILNIALGIFNLFPVPPLDGSRILTDMSAGYRRLMESGGGQFLAAVAFVLAFFFAGSLIFGVGMFVTRLGIGIISAIVGQQGP